MTAPADQSGRAPGPLHRPSADDGVGPGTGAASGPGAPGLFYVEWQLSPARPQAPSSAAPTKPDRA